MPIVSLTFVEVFELYGFSLDVVSNFHKLIPTLKAWVTESLA